MFSGLMIHRFSQRAQQLMLFAAAGANGSRPLQSIAERTEGYSGSDLQELCSVAAGIPVHEALQDIAAASSSG